MCASWKGTGERPTARPPIQHSGHTTPARPSPVRFPTREQWAEKEAKLRGKVKRVLKCDVTKANPAAPVSLPPADCVLSAYCLEAACPDLPAFHRALRGIAGLVRPGGHLVLLTSLSTTYYGVGEQVFSCLRLDEAAVLEAVEGAGFEVRFTELQPYPAGIGRSDMQATLILAARRRGTA